MAEGIFWLLVLAPGLAVPLITWLLSVWAARAGLDPVRIKGICYADELDRDHERHPPGLIERYHA